MLQCRILGKDTQSHNRADIFDNIYSGCFGKFVYNMMTTVAYAGFFNGKGVQ